MRYEMFEMKPTGKKRGQNVFYNSVCLLFTSLYNTFLKENVQ